MLFQSNPNQPKYIKMKTQRLKVDEIYEKTFIESFDLKRFKQHNDIDAIIYLNEEKVYFFEEIDSDRMKLYSVINKQSFYLI